VAVELTALPLLLLMPLMVLVRRGALLLKFVFGLGK
jgi:hypothetical protein